MLIIISAPLVVVDSVGYVCTLLRQPISRQYISQGKVLHKLSVSNKYCGLIGKLSDVSVGKASGRLLPFRLGCRPCDIATLASPNVSATLTELRRCVVKLLIPSIEPKPAFAYFCFPTLFIPTQPVVLISCRMYKCQITF